MPTSEHWQIPWVLEVIHREQPKSVLDVGAGYGKFGMLAREYAAPERVDALDVNQPRFETYDHVYLGDLRDIDRVLPEQAPVYDLALFIDTILVVYDFHEPGFEVAGHSLVQPLVAPGRVCDQVAGPGMRKLMRDNSNKAAVAGKQARRYERQPRVFHAAVGKARWQYEQIVPAPLVRAEQRLGLFEHLLGIGKFEH